MKTLITFLLTVSAATAAEDPHDLVIYGGTSGGVVAAVQAARSGHTVVLISPTQKLGGLTASGLGATDTAGYRQIIGGLARESSATQAPLALWSPTPSSSFPSHPDIQIRRPLPDAH